MIDFSFLVVYSVLNTFLLAFVIIYATLIRTQPLGDKDSINITVALIISLITILPEITGVGPNIVPTVNTIAPLFGLLLVAVVMVFIVGGSLGLKFDKKGMGYLIGVLIALDLAVPDALLFGAAAGLNGSLPSWLAWIQEPWAAQAIIIIVVFLAIIYYITKEEQ